MAKKKKEKKGVKQKASGGGTGTGASEGELQTAEALMRMGLAALVSLADNGIDLPSLVKRALASRQRSPVSESVSGEGKSDWSLVRLRNLFETKGDYDDTPYLRVVGKVVEVLTVHRPISHGKDYCTSGDVLRVFLKDIPQHCPYNPDVYRLPKPSKRGNEFDLSHEPGRTGIRDRLKELKKDCWLSPVTTAKDGSDRGYRLTDDGRRLFNGWPDVDGLHGDDQPASEQDNHG